MRTNFIKEDEIKEEKLKKAGGFFFNTLTSVVVMIIQASFIGYGIENSAFSAEIKEEVKTFLDGRKNSRLGVFGSEKPEHLLLYGPPGSGKSFLAKEIGENESCYYASVNLMMEYFHGSGKEKQDKIFRDAKRKLAKTNGEKPVIIIIDEIDSVGIKTFSAEQSNTETVNCLLTNIDEIENKNLNIIVIGITNHRQVLDEALVRPGRLGFQIKVDYPKEKAELDRIQIKEITWQEKIKCGENIGISLNDIEKAINYSLFYDREKGEITGSIEGYQKRLEKIRENKKAHQKDTELSPRGREIFFTLFPHLAEYSATATGRTAEFAVRGVKNVLLPTLIPFNLLEKEKSHIAGFKGHTLHRTAEEARQFALHILADYQNYAEKILGLGVIVGPKSEGEKFAGAVESYTVECLLPDGQCLQLATSHYFGDNFSIGAVVKAHADNWGVILPFAIAPVQIAFILAEPSEELVKYYREISGLLDTAPYRCQLYNESSRINRNCLQADQEGCPLKIILRPEELKNQEITLIRRDNMERKITVSLEPKAEDQQFLRGFEEELTRNLAKYDFLKGQERERVISDHEKSADSMKKGFVKIKIVEVINREIAEFEKNLRQKSQEFRDKHLFEANNFTELERKISAGHVGLFLIPFCNKLDCEKSIKDRISSYSIRCLYTSGEDDKI
ncbi:6530_t:CDS:2, partial [Gigaspora margarita]